MKGLEFLQYSTLVEILYAVNACIFKLGVFIAYLPAGGLRLPDVPSILKQKSSPLPESRLHIHDHTGCECEGSLGETSEDSFTHGSHESSLALDEEEEGDDESESDWRIFKVSIVLGMLSKENWLVVSFGRETEIFWHQE